MRFALVSLAALLAACTASNDPESNDPESTEGAQGGSAPGGTGGSASAPALGDRAVLGTQPGVRVPPEERLPRRGSAGAGGTTASGGAGGSAAAGNGGGGNVGPAPDYQTRSLDEHHSFDHPGDVQHLLRHGRSEESRQHLLLCSEPGCVTRRYFQEQGRGQDVDRNCRPSIRRSTCWWIRTIPITSTPSTACGATPRAFGFRPTAARAGTNLTDSCPQPRSSRVTPTTSPRIPATFSTSS